MNSNQSPLVSIIMPVYNAEKFLQSAVSSILSQSYSNIELIAINDGCSDHSMEILQSFNDARLRILSNERNFGIVYSLNVGLDNANGAYIARMDADDESLPDRIREQVDYMEKHTEIGLSGTWYENIGDLSGLVQLETEHDAIVFRLLYQFHMLHPSWIIRKSVLEEHHLRYKILYGEDYDFISNLIAHTRIANIPKYLIRYRQFSQSMSKSNAEVTIKNCLAIRKQLFKTLGISLNDFELILFEKIMHQDYETSISFIHSVDSLLSRLWNEFDTKNRILSEHYFRHKIIELWQNCLTNTSNLGFEGLSFYYFSNFRKSIKTISFKFKLKYFVKSILRR